MLGPGIKKLMLLGFQGAGADVPRCEMGPLAATKRDSTARGPITLRYSRDPDSGSDRVERMLRRAEVCCGVVRVIVSGLALSSASERELFAACRGRAVQGRLGSCC